MIDYPKTDPTHRCLVSCDEAKWVGGEMVCKNPRHGPEWECPHCLGDCAGECEARFSRPVNET